MMAVHSVDTILGGVVFPSSAIIERMVVCVLLVIVLVFLVFFLL